MTTPGQNPAAGSPQPADGQNGKAFLMNALFGGDPPDGQQNPQEPQVPATTPGEPSVSPAPAQSPSPTPTPQVPPVPVPPPEPVPEPAAYRFGDRYGADAPTSSLSNLMEIQAPEPTPEVQAPQNMNDAQNHAWAAMRAQMAQARKEAREYLAKYNGLVADTRKVLDEKTGFGEQLNAKDKEIESLRNEIGRMDLKRSPEFQDKYDKPIYAVRDDIARTLVDNGMKPDAANELAGQILDADRNRIPELVSELPNYAQGMVMIKAQEADRLFDARQHALDEWQTSQQGLNAVASRGSALMEAQRRDALVTKAIEMVKSVPMSKGQIPAYQVTDPSFVSDRDKHESDFRAWVQQASPETQYAMMLEGYMAPKTYEMLDHYAKENAQLKQALYGHARAANPRVSAGAPSWAPPPPEPPKGAPTQKTAGFSVAEDSVNSGAALVGGIFRNAGIMPPGM